MSNQDNFVYTHLSGVESSAISLVGYNENTQKMFIRFTSGNEIVYVDVPRAEYDALVDASSVGRYYTYNIKGEYKGDSQYNTRLRKSEAKTAKPVVVAKPTATVVPANVRFGVSWKGDNHAGGTPEFQAGDMDEALRLFNDAMAEAAKVGFNPTGVKVTAVTRYFD